MKGERREVYELRKTKEKKGARERDKKEWGSKEKQYVKEIEWRDEEWKVGGGVVVKLKFMNWEKEKRERRGGEKGDITEKIFKFNKLIWFSTLCLFQLLTQTYL